MTFALYPLGREMLERAYREAREQVVIVTVDVDLLGGGNWDVTIDDKLVGSATNVHSARAILRLLLDPLNGKITHIFINGWETDMSLLVLYS